MAKRKPDRAQLLKIIAANVRYLVRCETEESFRALEGIEELTLWLSNRHRIAHEALAKGILALSAIIDLDDLVNTAHGAVFYRRMHDGFTAERANEFADDALAIAGVDVDARNKAFDDVDGTEAVAA